jgi:hypothetical protein
MAQVVEITTAPKVNRDLLALLSRARVTSSAIQMRPIMEHRRVAIEEMLIAYALKKIYIHKLPHDREGEAMDERLPWESLAIG